MRFVMRLGESVIGLVEYVGRMMELLWVTFSYLLRLSVNVPLTVYHMSTMGVSSMPIVFLVTSFTGMMMSLEVTRQAVRFGSTRYVGGVLAIVLVREMMPVLTAVVMAGRVGSAIASELGSMKVTEQIDALRSLATSPAQYLVVPRMVALMIMIPVVTVFATLVSMAAAYMVAQKVGEIPFGVYLSTVPDFVKVPDIFGAMFKTVVFAVLIALVGCTEGMYTEGGASGVGRATTNSVVVSMVLIFGFNYFLSMLLF